MGDKKFDKLNDKLFYHHFIKCTYVGVSFSLQATSSRLHLGDILEVTRERHAKVNNSMHAYKIFKRFTLSFAMRKVLTEVE